MIFKSPRACYEYIRGTVHRWWDEYDDERAIVGFRVVVVYTRGKTGAQHETPLEEWESNVGKNAKRLARFATKLVVEERG